MKRLVLSILSSALCLNVSVSEASDYFLTGSQKRDLIWRGQMYDQQQRLYDVWVVPGYKLPLENVQKGWNNAGEALTDYGKASYYHDIAEAEKGTWRFGTRELLRDFAVKGSRDSWHDSMQTAQHRTEMRVFGWWLAYPWGALESTVESVLRVGIGVPVGVAVAASAYTVVPVGYAVTPLGKSVGYAAIQGTAYPLMAVTWNTTISPPLALLGQQPAPQRADGFWMKQVEDPRVKDLVAALTAWQADLVKELPQQEHVAQKAALNQQRKEQVAVLQQQINEINQKINQQEQALDDAWQQQLLAQAEEHQMDFQTTLQAKGLDMALLTTWREQLVQSLRREGWQTEDINRLLDVLSHGAKLPEGKQRSVNDKTNPIKRTLEIIRHGE